jgi:uncharacterized protein
VTNPSPRCVLDPMSTSHTPEHLTVEPTPWWLRGGHMETIVGSLFSTDYTPFASERRPVEVAPGSSLETWLSRPLAGGPARGSVLLVHGLGGSAERPHMRALAAEAVDRGWHAVRVNMRTHGGTAHLSSTLFNAVQSADLGEVLREMDAWGLPRPFALVGVSLGANMALRYAALEGDASRADSVAAVNPALDFFAVEREIQRPSNLVYRVNFVLSLCQMLNEVRALRPVDGPKASILNIHSVRDFDHAFTAPAAGYSSVDEYYRDASSAPLLDGLRVPTFILSAENDPFVPPEIMTPHHGRASGRVRVALANRGGHVGFRVQAPGGARFWAADPIMDWVDAQVVAAPGH